MNENKMPTSQILFMIAGEVVVSVITALVFLGLDKFSYKVVTGLALGSAVMLLSFIFLCISVNRAVDNIMAQRGSGEMDEEQVAEFAAKHHAELNKAVQLSHTGRMLAMIVVLVAAFLLDWFDVIATLVPLVAFQPILMLSGLIFNKKR